MNVLCEKLKEKIMIKDGSICVDYFLNQQIDIKLLSLMAKEFVERFKNEKITKILTIEAGGIALATAVGLILGVPVVYAKKEYSTKVPDNTLAVKIYSNTLKRSYYAYVNEEFFLEDDNVLIVDDIIANGWASDGLCDICNQGGANVVGICATIEKVSMHGGNRLREKGLRVETLVKINGIDSTNNKILYQD